jgi:hypothetical protein
MDGSVNANHDTADFGETQKFPAGCNIFLRSPVSRAKGIRKIPGRMRTIENFVGKIMMKNMVMRMFGVALAGALALSGTACAEQGTNASQAQSSQIFCGPGGSSRKS